MVRHFSSLGGPKTAVDLFVFVNASDRSYMYNIFTSDKLLILKNNYNQIKLITNLFIIESMSCLFQCSSWYSDLFRSSVIPLWLRAKQLSTFQNKALKRYQFNLIVNDWRKL